MRTTLQAWFLHRDWRNKVGNMSRTTDFTPEFLAETNGPNLNAANWSLIGVSAVFLVLRIYCKTTASRGLWWDDHLLLVSWLALVCNGTFSSINVTHGYGHHAATLTPEQKQATTLYYKIASTFSITASSWSRRLRYFIWFTVISVNLTKAGSAMVGWISCRPLAKSWDPLIVDGVCWDPKATSNFNMFSGVYSGFMDVVLAFLPWQVIMSLQMRTREKVGVAIAMSMGVFAGITAFVKCAKIPLLVGKDFTFFGWELVAWGSAETAMTIIACSIPVLRVLVRTIRSSAERHYNTGSYAMQMPNNPQQPGTAAGHTTLGKRSAIRNAVVTITGGKPKLGLGKRQPECSESMKSFEMQAMGPDRKSKILQTNEIRIEVQDRGKDDISVQTDDGVGGKVGESWPMY
ncbi:hypothetical protein jhhlp_007052 [Lomentospora prolificans]|uniref:Rhodopsin domain-containing protein n=1 Tax=Lomentospora prolificans TaxID=41688 RepID=A0A2N3N1I9_9PEZI|nr:hypothetical protein jhhlp_007052 [Lomentospora prolificans]